MKKMTPEFGEHGSTEALVLVSADCHAGPPRELYRKYVPAALAESLERWIAIAAADQETVANEFGLGSAWDNERRWEFLDRDGVAAEVVFPNFDVPFSGGISHASPFRHEEQCEGVRAYNRWLADFCAVSRGRRTGLIQILLADVLVSLKEIRRGVDRGLRGVQLPLSEAGQPLVYHPRYDAIWAECERLHVPVVVHGSTALPTTEWNLGLDEGEGPEFDLARQAARCINGAEYTFNARRTIWHLMFGGVFDRYPNLRFIVAEAGVDWVPDQFTYLDWLYDGSGFISASTRKRLFNNRPSDYLGRGQILFGASFMTLNETRLRHKIGVENLMFGVDFPHFETTTPNTKEWLQATWGASGVTRDEARRMAGATATEVFGFDPARLAEIAGQIGHPVDDVIRVPTTPFSAHRRMAGQDLRPVSL
jgi:predicted TIM-barrel fold metal-dependent hydrolase